MNPQRRVASVQGTLMPGPWGADAPLAPWSLSQ